MSHSMNRKRLYYLCHSIILIILLLAPVQAKSKDTSIYYFFPDSPSSNLSQLKGKVESLFRDLKMPVNFQPFARLTDLNRQMQKQPPDFLISPPWYATKHDRLKVLLNSYRNDKSTYSKLLISSAKLNSQNISFAGRSIAVTSMGYESATAIDVFDGAAFSSLAGVNIIEVVKDVDAIFAVALNQVDMAIVSQSTVNKLKKINPKIINTIQIIAESRPLSMPVLMHMESRLAQDELLAFISSMKKLKKNNVFEELLLIDEWRISQ